MKRTYIILTVLLMSLSINFSCSDLEEEPVGLLAPEAFYQTTSDVQIGINGAYSLLTHESFWGRKLPLSLLLRGDMASIGDMTTTSFRIEVDQMNMSATNGMVSAMWPKGYEILAALNYTMVGAESIDAADTEVNPLLAECRFLRAFIHFHFVRLFGEIPYIDFAFTDANIAYTLPQSSEDDIYAGIIEDLEFAKQHLTDRPVSKQRPGKGTAAAFLASVHLTRANYPAAYAEAKYVIDNSVAFGYSLEPEFADLFDPSIATPSNEVLFELDFKGNDASANPSSLGGTNAAIDYLASVTGPRKDERYTTGEGWSVAVPTLAAFNSFDPQDYRRVVSFDTMMTYNGVATPYTDWGAIPLNVARPHIAKYYRAHGEVLGEGNPAVSAGINARDSENDYCLMRYADVLLMAAEASNEVNGPTAEAEDYVNQVRKRARRELDADPTNDRAVPADVAGGLSKEEFTTMVLEERRVELAFEFGRWYDIKRRQLGVTAFGPSGLEQQNFDPARDYYYPKFQQDVDKNDNLTQNKGY
ncbi:RagB/SusD family nutrient uptake outer membrane protein [Reichenbachiella agarivorans]|uniref:RagB/SusD family nutrient uptake outer membrane protein n=1 Tax=Reichenbachiella agarivorans TaxID=2979464 RepID=A0ABY6CQI3_9BACT|nr:RagB/SusD family nutrient uptake outer membrane protein [Reichenbachiella agarivorans]UXP32776.1 RagB/SusD family nutrient uptake outer membrane protein [Reichenbachiella agarivorans]